MGVWSVAVLDFGVSNEFEAAHGRNLFERDIVSFDLESDPGETGRHGDLVALSIENMNPSLERVDYRIGTLSTGAITVAAACDGLAQVSALAGAGYDIGAANLSWGGSFYNSDLAAQIDELVARGITPVAAAGNSGSQSVLEGPLFPASLSNVIAVGSHDGVGNPSRFSQNQAGDIVVLADGENYPADGASGTSFSAPQVAATVATAQAFSAEVLGRRLTHAEVVDVLQQGGRGPLSMADPADGTTAYFLHDHAGSVSYLLDHYVYPEFSPVEYIASYADLEAAFGLDSAAALDHLVGTGVYEGREVTFDGLRYIAANPDLIDAFGADREAGASHYLGFGRNEGRGQSFSAADYLGANADLRVAFGQDLDAASRHYIRNGFAEGRTLLAGTASEAATDLAADASTGGFVAVGASATGTIATQDRDWFATTIEAGQQVRIDVLGSPTGGGTLSDPMVGLYGSDGTTLLLSDDDGGTGRNATLTFQAPSTAVYYVEVSGFSTRTGTYTVSLTETEAGSGLDLLAGAGGAAAREKVEAGAFWVPPEAATMPADLHAGDLV